MYKFDSLDQELITILKKDGRAPLSKLADILQVSRGTVQNRLDRLLNSGALLGFTVRVREESEPNLIKAIMSIEVMGKSTTQVIQKLRGMPELVKLHTTNGKWDLVAEIQVTSLQEFDVTLRKVRSIDGILNSETSLLLSSV
ncbi:Lrp/AsnC family transcriptional regulator [Kiloniella sp.]|uniref:Lrp/AsnC family transcriptional regulator n=1 Tax=Kiloniella sp. TaxID=1938587 RepID=UPI003A9540DE